MFVAFDELFAPWSVNFGFSEIARREISITIPISQGTLDSILFQMNATARCPAMNH
jgi:hypothetical protein